MNDAGLLRLMVSDPLAMNISNTLGDLRGELKDAGKTLSPKGKKSVSFGKRVLELDFVKKILLTIYKKSLTGIILRTLQWLSSCQPEKSSISCSILKKY